MEPMENLIKYMCTYVKFLYKFQKGFRETLKLFYRPFNRIMGMSADCQQLQGGNFSHISFKLEFPAPEQISNSIC